MENQNTSIWIIKNEIEMNGFITHALNKALKLEYTHRLIEGVERVDSIEDSEGNYLGVKWRKLETIEDYMAQRAERLDNYLAKLLSDLGQEFDSVVLACSNAVLDENNDKKSAFSMVGQAVTKSFLTQMMQELKPLVQ